MPRSRAKWLSVPSGRMPSTVSVPTSAEAAALIVPSPPPTTSSGVAALRDRLAAHRAIAAFDQLDLGVDARCLSAARDLVADLRIGGGGAAAAIEQDGMRAIARR